MEKYKNRMFVDIVTDLFLLFFIISSYVVVNYGRIEMHEYAHQAIFNNFGLDSEIIMTSYSSAVTIMTESDENLTQSQIDQMETLHSYNEIIGYNVYIIMLSIFIVSAIIVFGIRMKTNEVKWQIESLINELRNERKVMVLMKEGEKNDGQGNDGSVGG